MKKYRTLFTHLLFWIGYVTVAIFVYGYGQDDRLNTCLDTIGSHLISAGIFYTTALFIFPQLYAKRRFLLFILSLLTILVVSIIVRFVIPMYIYPAIFQRNMPMISTSNDMLVRRFFFQWFTFSLYAFFYWKSTVDKHKSQKEKLELEVAALRAQINPHFILNSLNRLQCQSEESDPKLSAGIGWFTKVLMSGIARPGPDGKIFLSIETQAILGTIYMFEERFPSLNLKFNMDADDADKYRILPHILLPFVENVLKHGKYKDPDHPIRIDLKLEDGIINLTVFNRKSNVITDTSNGIGLRYVRRQLESGYSQKYSLIINETDVDYRVELSVKLN